MRMSIHGYNKALAKSIRDNGSDFSLFYLNSANKFKILDSSVKLLFDEKLIEYFKLRNNSQEAIYLNMRRLSKDQLNNIVFYRIKDHVKDFYIKKLECIIKVFKEKNVDKDKIEYLESILLIQRLENI